MIAEAAVLRNHTTASQCAKILARLQAGKTITPLEALDEYGVGRLAARVADLRNEGHVINSRLITVFNRDGAKCRVAEYSMTQGDASLEGAM